MLNEYNVQNADGGCGVMTLKCIGLKLDITVTVRDRGFVAMDHI